MLVRAGNKVLTRFGFPLRNSASSGVWAASLAFKLTAELQRSQRGRGEFQITNPLSKMK